MAARANMSCVSKANVGKLAMSRLLAQPFANFVRGAGQNAPKFAFKRPRAQPTADALFGIGCGDQFALCLAFGGTHLLTFHVAL